MEVARDLNCLQLDPISVVARSHQLVLWSRLGTYDVSEFDKLRWPQGELFEYWAHAASICLTEDYQIYRRGMLAYPKGDSKWHEKTRVWLRENESHRRQILGRLKKDGPLPLRALDGPRMSDWMSGGWTNGRNTERMIHVLWTQGKIMVAGRKGIEKYWDLAERVLPSWTPREPMTEQQATSKAAEYSLRSLGVATAADIRQNFVMRYPGLEKALVSLRRRERIESVAVEGLDDEWFAHTDDLRLLDRIEAGDWTPRTTLLSPFDNLIRDRARLERLFGFEYRIEIYVPKAKRRYGYYVLPILDGDRIVGRMDPAMDRSNGRLTIKAVYAEPGAPASAGKGVAASVEDLATFLGATDIAFSKQVPAAWKRALVI
jgi:uncharacterized protein YcaQ